jgi:hypothetical protein
MKTTIDIPDDLYRKVKAKSALLGKPIRQITIELYQQWLQSNAGHEAEPAPSAEAWLEQWFRQTDAAMREAPAGPTAREILEADRQRRGGA